ncbi:MAG: transposase [Oscillospiraceae bacterium]|nr:transposase [Oscillospiraceae bacterium]
MNQKYTESEKLIITTRYKKGEAVSDIVMNTGIPRSTIYAWIKHSADMDTNKKSVSLKNYRILENKVARLQGIIEIMK